MAFNAPTTEAVPTAETPLARGEGETQLETPSLLLETPPLPQEPPPAVPAPLNPVEPAEDGPRRRLFVSQDDERERCVTVMHRRGPSRCIVSLSQFPCLFLPHYPSCPVAPPSSSLFCSLFSSTPNLFLSQDSDVVRAPKKP